MKSFWKKPLRGLLVAAILGIFGLVPFTTLVMAAPTFQVKLNYPVELHVPEPGSGTFEFTILNPDFTGEIKIDAEHMPFDYEPKMVTVAEGEDKDVTVTFHGNDKLESVSFGGDILLTPVSDEAYIGGYKIPIGVTHGDEPFLPGYFLDVYIDPEGSGSVTLDPSIGPYPYGLYQSGKVVTLTATPNSGWLFDSWAGDVADPNSAITTITMDRDKSVTARFTRVKHTLTMSVSPEGAGTVNPEAGAYIYDEGTVVPISASPGAGWYFVNWSGDVTDPNASSTTVAMDSDKTVTANFTEISYTLTMSVSPEGAGTVTPAAGIHTYGEGSIVTLTATSTAGWKFTNWSGDVADPGVAITTITMDSDKSVTANFGEVYILTMAVDGEGSTDPAVGMHAYTPGTEVIIKATPDEGWKFDSWSGDVDDPGAAITTVTMDKDKSVTAKFSEKGGGFPWWIILCIVAGVILVGLIIFFLLRRKYGWWGGS